MASLSDEKLTTLIGSIYEAANSRSPEAWLSVYKELAEHLHSGHGGFDVFVEKVGDFSQISYTVGTDFLDPYNEYRHISPIREDILNLKSGEHFSSIAQMADSDFEKTEIYQDLLKRFDIFQVERQIVLDSKDVKVGIAFTRPKGKPALSKDEHAFLDKVMPHLGRAFSIYFQLKHIDTSKTLVFDCLNSLPQAILILDHKCRLKFANNAGHEVLKESIGLTILKNGVVTSQRADDQIKLAEAVASIFEIGLGVNENHGSLVKIRQGGNAGDLHLLVAPLSSQFGATGGGERAAMVMIHDRSKEVSPADVVLQELYGLTPAESQFASLLVTTSSFSSVCELLGIKQNTGRTHLKRIFSKTGTNRQSTLVALILNGPARHSLTDK